MCVGRKGGGGGKSEDICDFFKEEAVERREANGQEGSERISEPEANKISGRLMDCHESST